MNTLKDNFLFVLAVLGVAALVSVIPVTLYAVIGLIFGLR